MSGLRIARELELPTSAVTEVISFLATRGAGKSFGSADILEELHAAGLQFVVVDPMGVYWGLRSSRDGKKPGLDVVVLGGELGDVPLEPTSGKLIADVVVDSGRSFVIDLSLFDSKAEQIRFMEAFLERIFYRKGPMDARTPLLVVVDEADEFAPQKPQQNETRMLSHMIRLAKRGRTRGIGLMPLTQRSAEFSKAILDLSSAVFFMRTAGPRDRDAIKKWMAGSAPDLIALVDKRFPKLATGEALVYSPHWLQLEEPAEIHFRMIRTYDSYKTPEAGAARATPARRAEIDLAALGEQIQATVERAKENDPAELRRRLAAAEQVARHQTAVIDDLHRDLAAAATERIVEKPVEVPVLSDGQVGRLENVAKELAGVAASVSEFAGEILGQVRRVHAGEHDPASISKEEPWKRPRSGRSASDATTAAPSSTTTTRVRPTAVASRATSTPRADGVSGPQQRILDALAALEAIGLQDAHKTQLALFAQASPKSSSFTNNLGHLNNQLGLITYPVPGRVALTPDGRAVADAAAAPGSTDELHRFVYGLVGGAKARLLEQLIAHYPAALEKTTLAELAGASPTSSSFTNNLGSLRSLGLIDYPARGEVAALPILFLEERA